LQCHLKESTDDTFFMDLVGPATENPLSPNFVLICWMQ